MKNNKNKIFIALAIVLTLGIAFWYGGNAPGLSGWSSDTDRESDTEKIVAVSEVKDKEKKDGKNKEVNEELKNANDEIQKKLDEADKEIEEKLDEEKLDEEKLDEENLDEDNQENLDEESQEKIDQKSPEAIEKENESKSNNTEEKTSTGKKDSKTYSKENGMEIDSETGKDEYLTDPVPEGKPIPVEPESKPITNEKRTATLSVRVDTLLNNLDVLPPNKVDLVPEDGIIYAAKRVQFSEGESVFDLLLREMKKSKIHMEFVNTPMYNSAYIQGINNLYEFDGGELSGWMYKVNGWFPNYGVSRYSLKEGDKVDFVYTLDLGADVGGSNSMGGN